MDTVLFQSSLLSLNEDERQMDELRRLKKSRRGPALFLILKRKKNQKPAVSEDNNPSP
jgi:hypothetical protein